MPIMPEKKPPPRIKPKSLKDEECALWRAATSDVKRIHQKSPPIPETPPVSVHPRSKSKGDIPLIGIIALETNRPSRTPDKSSFQLDSGLKKRFERGDLPLDGTLDLHGLTLEQAHRRFVRFVMEHIRSGSRFLLVVTGKGVGGEGLIRKNLPMWCDADDLKGHILQRSVARPHHGGSGACYLLLRRQKPPKNN